MENIILARKCSDLLKSVNRLTEDLLNRNDVEFSKEFLDVSMENLRYCELISEVWEALTGKLQAIENRTNPEKPAVRNSRTVSLPFDLGQNLLPNEKRINVLSDICLTQNNNHFDWYENPDDFMVGRHVGASVEVQYDEGMGTNEVEFLGEVDQNDGNDDEQGNSDTPIKNESLMNSTADADGEGYDTVLQVTMQQYTSSATEYRYIRYITAENDVLIPANDEISGNENTEFSPDTDSHHKRSLVLAAIEQMATNIEPNVQINEEKYEQCTPQSSSQLADFQMDIQAVVNVGTPSTNANDCGENDVGPMLNVSEIPSRPKRQRKVVPAYELYLKERTNARATPKTTTTSVKATKPLKQLVNLEQPDGKLAKANEKRKSATRKTISGSRSTILNKDHKANVATVSADTKWADAKNKRTDNELPSGLVPTKAMKKCFARRNTVACARNESTNDKNIASSSTPKNTNWQMYYKNKIYQTCLYCTNKFAGSLAHHYAKSHSDREVPVSRISPEMAMHLKMQTQIFKKDAEKKITGFCYFCEEDRCGLKVTWQRHLVAHTGEEMFHCTHCNAQLKAKNQHDAKPCESNVVNVFDTKEDGSLVGFMCNECNYIQISRDRLVDHMTNEHGFQSPSEPHHFKGYKLVEGVF